MRPSFIPVSVAIVMFASAGFTSAKDRAIESKSSWQSWDEMTTLQEFDLRSQHDRSNCETYRAVGRSYHLAIGARSVRIDACPNLPVVVTTRKTTWVVMPWELPELESDRARTISNQEFEEFRGAIEAIQFWTLPANDGLVTAPDRVLKPPCIATYEIITFEGLRNGDYREANWPTCEPPISFAPLTQQLRKLFD